MKQSQWADSLAVAQWYSVARPTTTPLAACAHGRLAAHGLATHGCGSHSLAGLALCSGPRARALLARRLRGGGSSAGHGGATRGSGDMAVRVDSEQCTGRRCGGRTGEWSRGRQRLVVDGALRLGRRRHGGFGNLRVAEKGVRHDSEGEVSAAVGGAGKGGSAAALLAEEQRRDRIARRRGVLRYRRSFGHRAGRNSRCLYGTGAMAVPPGASNPSGMCDSLSADRRAPHVSAFPFSEILKIAFRKRKIDTR
jgi:hypothetical protein